MSKKQLRPMQESENYFWYYDDILGKGATGEVYKCLEKVGYQIFECLHDDVMLMDKIKY